MDLNDEKARNTILLIGTNDKEFILITKLLQTFQCSSTTLNDNYVDLKDGELNLKESYPQLYERLKLINDNNIIKIYPVYNNNDNYYSIRFIFITNSFEFNLNTKLTEDIHLSSERHNNNSIEFNSNSIQFFQLSFKLKIEFEEKKVSYFLCVMDGKIFGIINDDDCEMNHYARWIVNNVFVAKEKLFLFTDNDIYIFSTKLLNEMNEIIKITNQYELINVKYRDFWRCGKIVIGSGWEMRTYVIIISIFIFGLILIGICVKFEEDHNILLKKRLSLLFESDHSSPTIPSTTQSPTSYG